MDLNFVYSALAVCTSEYLNREQAWCSSVNLCVRLSRHSPTPSDSAPESTCMRVCVCVPEHCVLYPSAEVPPSVCSVNNILWVRLPASFSLFLLPIEQIKSSFHAWSCKLRLRCAVGLSYVVDTAHVNLPLLRHSLRVVVLSYLAPAVTHTAYCVS